MKLIRQITDLNKAISNQKELGFVPTMGGLHKGHASLINLSKKKCKNIKVYIFGTSKNFFINKLKKFMEYEYFLDLKHLVKKLSLEIKLDKNKTHKTILFSPSAASFDNFKNFEK